MYFFSFVVYYSEDIRRRDYKIIDIISSFANKPNKTYAHYNSVVY